VDGTDLTTTTDATQLYPMPDADDFRLRLSRVWAAMDRDGVDALLVYGDSASNGGNLANIRYLAGYRDPLFAYVVVIPDREPMLAISNPLYLPFAKEMAATSAVEAVSWDPGAHLAGMLADAGLSRARIGLVGTRGIQRSTLPHAHHEVLLRELPEVTWTDATELMVEVRSIKSAGELALIRRGAAITDATLVALRDGARIGMSEVQLAGLVHARACELDGEQRLTFIGATPMDDPQLVFPRQLPSLRRIRPGDVVLTELSTSYGGYSGQIHRPFAVGRPPTDTYRLLFDTAVEVYGAVLDVLGPGATDGDVRAAVGPVLRRDDVMTMDALIHGWGLTIEPPRLDVTERATIQRPQEPTVFQPGMTFVVQPHLLSPDQSQGLQVGALIAVTDDGYEVLDPLPMEFAVLDA